MIALFVILLLFPKQIAKETFHELVLWNVGQGLWVTISRPTHCTHIDMGGEKAPWSAIKKICHNKKQFLYLTHYDWDHIRFIGKWHRRSKKLCLVTSIHFPISLSKERMLKKIPTCSNSDLETLFDGSNKSSNHQSRVFQYKHQIVIPGDSPSRGEKVWRWKARSAEILVLGHHGSKTSSSAALLKTLTQLRMTLVSARKSKYGHPHPVVMKRLKKHRVPLLTTEDWGNIHIILEK